MKQLHQIWKPSGDEYGMALATVIDTDDQDGLGRIKVEYLLKLDGEGKRIQSDWLQFVSPFAGEGYGMFFLPERGARALVAYSGSNPARAYVVGFLWDGEKTPPVERESRANVRVIRTKQGKQIEIDDSENGKIEIRDDKDNLFRINTSDGTVEIACSGGVSINVKDGKASVAVTREGSLSIDAPGGLKFTGANISLKADTRITLSAPELSYESV
ncbi:Rhs element Vgr protein [Trinickia dinghuensis]|uniref:Rhs element Vgr protein n=2 Tax=Trinickia dinghuensis TaxID=2291023 RepID=A0A3D8JX13_9BURK|nr:Rhs element Vgr protein [Trinickia dinghuensis]